MWNSRAEPSASGRCISMSPRAKGGLGGDAQAAQPLHAHVAFESRQQEPQRIALLRAQPLAILVYQHRIIKDFSIECCASMLPHRRLRRPPISRRPAIRLPAGTSFKLTPVHSDSHKTNEAKPSSIGFLCPGCPSIRESRLGLRRNA